MPNPVNSFSVLDENVTSLDNFASSPVMSFSMTNLLGENKEDDDEMLMDEPLFQEEFSDETSDTPIEMTAAEFLQYWELPQPQRVDFTFEDPIVNSNENFGSESAPLDDNAGERLFADPVLTKMSILRQDENVKSLLNVPLPGQDQWDEYAKNLPASNQNESNASFLDQDKTDKYVTNIPVRQNNKNENALILSQDKPEDYAANTPWHSNKINEKAASEIEKIEVTRAEKLDTPNSKTQLQEQTFSIDELILKSKNADIVGLQQPEFKLQAREAIQENSDTTMQLLTNHLSDFVSQSLSPKASEMVNSPFSASSDIQSQIKMELVSLQAEPLAQGADHKVENYTAQIKVYPPELGQITAKIEVNQGVATIAFITEHAHVKQLMELNLHQLQTAFSNSNLNLTSVNIHNGGSQDRKEQPMQTTFQEDDLELESNGNKPTEIIGKQTINSIIDTYA